RASLVVRPAPKLEPGKSRLVAVGLALDRAGLRDYCGGLLLARNSLAGVPFTALQSELARALGRDDGGFRRSAAGRSRGRSRAAGCFADERPPCKARRLVCHDSHRTPLRFNGGHYCIRSEPAVV